MSEPLPCPFCGEAPRVIERFSGMWTVECNAPCLVYPTVKASASSREAVLECWNTRAPVKTRKLIPVCPDCNHDTSDHDTVEGAAHCRYCGYPVDEPGAST